MGRNRKHRRRKRHGHGLHGITNVHKTQTYMETLKEGGLLLLTAIAASGAGAVLGKHSLLVGLPVTMIGIHKENKYITAAGIGLSVSNGFQSATKPATTTQGIDGLDAKQIASEAKERLGTFFKNFSEKLYLPQSPTVNGLGEAGGEEQVTYFMNPYNSAQQIDMSSLDRIQEQIAQMNKPASDLNDIEREF